MAYRPFIGKTKEWLAAQLSAAQDDLAAGTVNVGGGEGDATFTDISQGDPQSRIRMILQELSILDPVTYPPAVARQVKTSKGIFSGYPC